MTNDNLDEVFWDNWRYPKTFRGVDIDDVDKALDKVIKKTAQTIFEELDLITINSQLIFVGKGTSYDSIKQKYLGETITTKKEVLK